MLKVAKNSQMSEKHFLRSTKQGQAKTLVPHFITRCLCHKMQIYTFLNCTEQICKFGKISTCGQKVYLMKVKSLKF